MVVRLAEVDAPEKAQPFGQRSKELLSTLCFRKQAEIRPSTRDRYGRTVAHVICAGTDANAAMVRTGMAWAYTRYLTDPQIRAMEVVARRENWDCGPTSILYPRGSGGSLVRRTSRLAGRHLWSWKQAPPRGGRRRKAVSQLEPGSTPAQD